VALLRATGLLEVLLPVLATVPDRALDHVTRVLAGVAPDPALRFAALLHVLPAEVAERSLVELRQPRRVSDEVAALLRGHACRLAARAEPLPGTAVEVRRFLSRVGPQRAGALLALAEAEAGALTAPAAGRARGEVKKLEREISQIRRAAPALVTQELALDGRAAMAILAVGPGPHVGEALRHLLDRVLDDPGLNTPAALEEELRRWWAARERRS
jgi:tRNA nucleotidyltransferase (CCA-adding enzyme)